MVRFQLLVHLDYLYNNMSKLSKKASANIIAFIQKINPNISKQTSYDEAWEVISEYGKITGNLTTHHNSKRKVTQFDIIKESDDSVIYSFQWDNEKVFCEGDWDWTIIFKEVIEYVIKNKIVKKPRKTAQISQKNSKQYKLSSLTKNSVKSQENDVKIDSMSVDELKRKKNALYGRIRDWKIKGKDATELIKEYNKISELCKKK